MNRPAELLRSLVADVGRLEPGVKGLDRDLITIQKRVKDEGIGFFARALPTLGHALERGLADGKFACPMGFARVPGGSIPKLFSGMICKIFDTVSGALLQDASVESLVSLTQICFLFEKLVQKGDREEELDRLARNKFVEDDSLCGFSFTERQNFIFDAVCRYIMPNLDRFDPREVICRHGPGAVYEKLTPNQKWQALCTYSSALDHMGFDTFYSTVYADGEDELVLNGEISVYGASGDVAKLVTVPKNTSARRTITIEPVVRQFVQQGFNAIIRREIDRCSILSRCISLTDQSKNQHLALEGSRTGEWATLDLKAASDRIALELVETLFARRPLFLEGLLSCRSPFVLNGKDRLTLRKYAGMGNATTFPVQSVLFAVLAICALLEDLRPSASNVRRVARLVRVYGDDIIVPSDKVHQVRDWITAAGLIVNDRKSFAVGNFRESCGVRAFKGVDTTPVYVRHHPVEISRKRPNALASFVELSNHLWLRGYYTASTCVRDWVEKVMKKTLPLIPRESGALGWHCIQGVPGYQRWNRDLHRGEIFAPVLVTVKSRDEIDGYAALLKFFHYAEGRRSDYLSRLYPLNRDADHLGKSPLRFQVRIASRWVPT